MERTLNSGTVGNIPFYVVTSRVVVCMVSKFRGHLHGDRRPTHEINCPLKSFTIVTNIEDCLHASLCVDV